VQEWEILYAILHPVTRVGGAPDGESQCAAERGVVHLALWEGNYVRPVHGGRGEAEDRSRDNISSGSGVARASGPVETGFRGCPVYGQQPPLWRFSFASAADSNTCWVPVDQRAAHCGGASGPSRSVWGASFLFGQSAPRCPLPRGFRMHFWPWRSGDLGVRNYRGCSVPDERPDNFCSAQTQLPFPRGPTFVAMVPSCQSGGYPVATRQNKVNVGPSSCMCRVF